MTLSKKSPKVACPPRLSVPLFPALYLFRVTPARFNFKCCSAGVLACDNSRMGLWRRMEKMWSLMGQCGSDALGEGRGASWEEMWRAGPPAPRDVI